MTLNYLHVLTHTHEVATHKSLRRSLEHVNHYRCSDKRIQRSKLVYHRQFYVVTGGIIRSQGRFNLFTSRSLGCLLSARPTGIHIEMDQTQCTAAP